MVKFNKFHVANETTIARVHYSLDNRIDGRKVVTIYAKDYGHDLAEIFPGITENNSDIMTDLHEKDRVRLFEDHPMYAAARARIESFQTK